MTKPTLTVTKGYTPRGHLSIRMTLRARDYPRDSITAQADKTITTAEAREFALSLILAADEEDAKVAKDQATQDRRKKWMDREVAAGRIKVMSAAEFFGGRS